MPGLHPRTIRVEFLRWDLLIIVVFLKLPGGRNGQPRVGAGTCAVPGPDIFVGCQHFSCTANWL